MTALQDIIPGCNKVHVLLVPACEWCYYSLKNIQQDISVDQIIGKALVLDEIINYIQSLQRQVEVKVVNTSLLYVTIIHA